MKLALFIFTYSAIENDLKLCSMDIFFYNLFFYIYMADSQGLSRKTIYNFFASKIWIELDNIYYELLLFTPPTFTLQLYFLDLILIDVAYFNINCIPKIIFV